MSKRTFSAAELVGKTFGKWTALAVAPSDEVGEVLLVRCACGLTKELGKFRLLHGSSRSCRACSIRTHGAGSTKSGRPPSYNAWARMVQRCHNPKNPSFGDYGARGIAVCDEWRGPGGFERFLASVGEKPSPDLSIDRIDNDRGYEPGNVRWATRSMQMSNRRASTWAGRRRLSDGTFAAGGSEK